MKSKYTSALADDICRWIASGETLYEWCRNHDISHQNVYNWLEAHADFAASYARAREIGQDVIAEQTLHIANTPILGQTEKINADGGVEITKADMLGHRKLQIETRLKLLAKWNPKKYGDKVELNGPNGGPIQILAATTDEKL
jgi:hypothetical protein